MTSPLEQILARFGADMFPPRSVDELIDDLDCERRKNISLRRLVFRANSIVDAFKRGERARFFMALAYYHEALTSHRTNFERDLGGE